jgi:hypothetical protein
MPYSKSARYEHHRQRPPKQFYRTRFRNVKLSHTDYSGEKYDVPGARAVVGKLKPQFRTARRKGAKPRAWAVQSILIPKKRK